MGKTYPALDERLREFIREQPMYFVATAPTDGGHVNVSPKGYADTFRVIDDRTIAYLDLDGSGVETIAHLRQNGRITVMFCAFSGPPKILRLYGRGRTVTPTCEGWTDLLGLFGPHPGVRSIIVVDVHLITDSCGFSVPLMTYESDRDLLDRWSERKETQEKRAYRAKNNRESIDGIPALSAAETDPVNQRS
ncbi:pyridoxamine 5'-phosphate oxidase family protein [Rhizohabitans arisaemae]|uniref:pyridoxamine 5'-phosphate oxidase family protein n=1 Tax=Rhizohabitans arisaemae TaxID=2720610 RepID=UPI0024B26CB0|nr:pyridoxamine 5'-phosphate oxidase family protein [Rhizohabitans arisaemae]